MEDAGEEACKKGSGSTRVHGAFIPKETAVHNTNGLFYILIGVDIKFMLEVCKLPHSSLLVLYMFIPV